MTTKNTGGLAFPWPVADQECCGRFESGYGGVSLREYYAAKFSAAWVQAITASHAIESREAIAIEANRLGLLQADHMLKQQEQS